MNKRSVKNKIDKDITNMKCWVFRLAEKKWNKNNIDLAKLFDKNNVYDFIDDSYDYLHLMSYDSVVDEIELYLREPLKI